MNVKASVAAAVLAVSTIGVTACGSSASRTGAAAAPTSAAGQAASTTASPASPEPPAATPSSADPSAPGPGHSTAPQTRAPVRTDIPASATLLLADLAPSASGAWRPFGGPAVTASQIVDPDNCDPVPRPQSIDPTYPRNPAWVSLRNVAWASTLQAEVGESVVTYSSAAAASADFVKHRGWVANCADHFQWTDAPAKYSISTAQLNGVPDSYAIRVAMDPPEQPAATAGSMGVDYMAVILRGNSLTVLNVSNTGPVTSKPQDPGLASFQHDVQVAASKLTAVYAPTH